MTAPVDLDALDALRREGGDNEDHYEYDLALRDAAPQLIAECRALRARVAELGVTVRARDIELQLVGTADEWRLMQVELAAARAVVEDMRMFREWVTWRTLGTGERIGALDVSVREDDFASLVAYDAVRGEK